jgi:hypothetical protein
MGKLFGTTFPIISKRVGEGGQTSGDDVKRINQLLRLAGYLKVKLDKEDKWVDASEEALINFYKVWGIGPVKKYIEKNDRFDDLLALAQVAGVLIKLPAGLRSASALTALYDRCRSANYPYAWKDVAKNVVYGGGTKVIWGFEDRPSWAVVTTPPLDKCCFSSTLPISLNCTSFANLMLSVWKQGNAHSQPYDASQMGDGYDDNLGSRYALHPVHDGNLFHEGYCHDVDAIKQKAQPGRLYYLGLCGPGLTTIAHDVVLLDGFVYECNHDKATAVYKTKIDERLKRVVKNQGARMYGPMPF